MLSKAEHKLDAVYFSGSSGGEACEAAMKNELFEALCRWQLPLKFGLLEEINLIMELEQTLCL